MTMTRVVSEDKRGANLANFTEIQYDGDKTAAYMEHLFYRPHHTDEIGKVGALENICEQENCHEEIWLCDALTQSLQFRIFSRPCFGTREWIIFCVPFDIHFELVVIIVVAHSISIFDY